MNIYQNKVDLTHSKGLLDLLREARKKPDELTELIRECEDIIHDCHHYLEMNVMKAPDQQKVTNVLRDTLRKKRRLLDERVLVCTALGVVDGRPLREGDRSFEYHYNRVVDDNRYYRPKRITIHQILGTEPDPSTTNTKFANLARFSSKGVSNA